MLQAPIARAGLVVMVVAATMLVSETFGMAQSCDQADARVVQPGLITCGSCTELLQVVSCTRPGEITHRVLCQPANWNGGQDFGWQSWPAVNAFADCGHNASGPPQCFPAIDGPIVFGVTNGKWEYRWSRKAGRATFDTTIQDTVCATDGATTTQVENTIALLGCCADACSNSTAHGVIDGGFELFGNFTTQSDPRPGEERNGFRALAEFDLPANGGNGNGLIDARDSVFDALLLWTDRNHDGISQTSELASLRDADISAIHVDYQLSHRRDDFGNVFRYRAKVDSGRANSVGRWAFDVYLLLGQQRCEAQPQHVCNSDARMALGTVPDRQAQPPAR